MLPRILVAILVTAVLVSSPTTFAKEVFKKVDRIVAVGDLHGDYNQFLRVLQQNELIDEDGEWDGGKTHFVQVGDITDRGPDSLKIIEHLQDLEKQAEFGVFVPLSRLLNEVHHRHGLLNRVQIWHLRVEILKGQVTGHF